MASEETTKNGKWNPDSELVKLNQLISQRSSAHLKWILRQQGSQKEQSSKSYLDYTVEDLRNRITNHPNWKLVKDHSWHIDHIFPVKAFVKNGITDIKIINALDNLQPLEKTCNLSKGGKYNKEEFLNWLKFKKHCLCDDSK